MDAWLSIVIRQIMLYSLPMLVSLTVVGLIEGKLMRRPMPHPFHPLAWRGTWFPFLASICFHRAVIFALPQPIKHSATAAAIRCAAHAMLCLTGFLLYAWSLQHHPPAGLPPLHHWWAKVLMFFNLCMVFLHLLPLPGMWLGEALLASRFAPPPLQKLNDYTLWIFTLLAASPLPDWLPGAIFIFPVYEYLASSAAGFAAAP